jgi:hypothetical protein
LEVNNETTIYKSKIMQRYETRRALPINPGSSFAYRMDTSEANLRFVFYKQHVLFTAFDGSMIKIYSLNSVIAALDTNRKTACVADRRVPMQPVSLPFIRVYFSSGGDEPTWCSTARVHISV